RDQAGDTGRRQRQGAGVAHLEVAAGGVGRGQVGDRHVDVVGVADPGRGPQRQVVDRDVRLLGQGRVDDRAARDQEQGAVPGRRGDLRGDVDVPGVGQGADLEDAGGDAVE